jgi:hypothetical protein
MKNNIGNTSRGRGRKIEMRIRRGRKGRTLPEKLFGLANPACLFMM